MRIGIMDLDDEDICELRLHRHSGDYADLPVTDHWFLMAKAYQDCSVHMFKEWYKKG